MHTLPTQIAIVHQLMLVALLAVDFGISDPICIPILLVNQLKYPVDMFDPDSFGRGVRIEADCSRLSEPSIQLVMDPSRQPMLLAGEARNHKVSVGYECTGGVNRNVTTTLRNIFPWTTDLRPGERALALGDECTIFGCYWYTNWTEFRAMAWALPVVTCTIDYNECKDGTAQCQQDCIDVVNSYNCSCWDGYQLEPNAHNCSDIDECSTGAHFCSDYCTNTIGSYNCSCPEGLMLAEDGVSCVDINECDGNHLCEHMCSNANGSYECMCPDGFQVSNNGYNCTDYNECDGEQICDQQCNNTVGSFHCSCYSGYVLNPNGFSCKDIDECEDEQNTVFCHHICTNTMGSYICSCEQDFKLSSDGYNCTAKIESSVPDLVLFLPWLSLILLAGALAVTAGCIYYLLLRRRPHRNVLLSHPDLYKYYLREEEIDYSYQPVDLTNGLSPDRQSMHSDMTFFQTSCTVENLSQYTLETPPNDSKEALINDNAKGNEAAEGEKHELCSRPSSADSEEKSATQCIPGASQGCSLPVASLTCEEASAGTSSESSNTSAASSDYISQLSIPTTPRHPPPATAIETTSLSTNLLQTNLLSNQTLQHCPESGRAQATSATEHLSLHDGLDSSAEGYIDGSAFLLKDYRTPDDDNEDSSALSQMKLDLQLQKPQTLPGGDSSLELEDPMYGMLMVLPRNCDSDVNLKKRANSLPDAPSANKNPLHPKDSFLAQNLNFTTCVLNDKTHRVMEENLTDGSGSSVSSIDPQFVIRLEPEVA